MTAVQTRFNYILGLDGGNILDLSPRDAGRLLALSSVTGTLSDTASLPSPLDFEYVGQSQAWRPGLGKARAAK